MTRLFDHPLPRRCTTFVVLAISLFASRLAYAQDETPFALHDGQRVVFLGDSITQGGTYVVYLDAYVRTRFPQRSIEMINHGLSSETINGMSEDDHPGRRPWIHDRLERDALAWEPDVLSVCYGMNDGNYFPMHPERFAKYKEGYARFFERVADAGDPRVFVLTPAPFDAYRRKTGDEAAKDYGYRFPAVDYDRTLEAYSEWLLTLDRPQTTVIDLHGPMNDWLRERRVGEVNYSFSPDAVHPDPTGHLLMALRVIDGWNAPESLARIAIAVASPTAETATAEASIPLPMPRDSRWDEKMLSICGWGERTQTVVVEVDVAEGDWKLSIVGKPGSDDGEAVTLYEGDHSAERLREGVELNADAWDAMDDARGEFLEKLQQRHKLVYGKWRSEIAAGNDGKASIEGEEVAKLDADLRRLAQPWSVVANLQRSKE